MVPPIDPCDLATPGPCGVNPAFSYTRYPCDFDDPRPGDTRGLPVIIDLQTPITAETSNRLRESTLAMESELGLSPAGTYNTVRDRLDSLDLTLCEIWNAITGGGSPVNVLHEGSLVVTSVQALNFIGGVTVTDAGGFQANITISGGDGYEPVHEAVPIVANGQTNFTLVSIPWDGLVLVFIDGLKQEMSDYVVTGNNVVWGGEPLLTTDILEVLYFKEGTGGGGGGGSGNTVMHQEVFDPTPGQTLFTVAGIPLSGQATEMFIDGISMTYNVDYTVSGSNITYNNFPVLDGNETVVIKYFEDLSVAPAGTDELIKVSAIDTTPDYLEDKLVFGGDLDGYSFDKGGGDLAMFVHNLTPAGIVGVNNTDTVYNYLEHKITVGPGFFITPLDFGGGNLKLVLTQYAYVCDFTLAAGANNNVAFSCWNTGHAHRFDSPAPAVITGLNIFGGDGVAIGDIRIKKICNVGSFTITINNEDIGSVDINRIITPGGAPYVLNPNDIVDIFYDITTQRWRVG